MRFLNYLCQLIYVFCVRQGWLISPSLSFINENPNDFDAKINESGVEWTRKTK